MVNTEQHPTIRFSFSLQFGRFKSEKTKEKNYFNKHSAFVYDFQLLF